MAAPGSSSGNGRETRITQQSWVTVGLLAVIVGATAMLSSERASVLERVDRLEKDSVMAADIRTALLDIAQRLAVLETQVTALGRDRWRGRDMQRWATRLKEANAAGTPDIVIPVPITNEP